MTPTINAEQNDLGSCHFARVDGSSTYSLDILVQQHVPSLCRTDSEKLAGIGTSAVSCTVEHSGSSLVEQIDAQVRDLHFTSVLTIRNVKLSTAQQQTQRDAFHRAAEQIAGNLF